jgi:hypothetical protein
MLLLPLEQALNLLTYRASCSRFPPVVLSAAKILEQKVNEEGCPGNEESK